MKIIITGTSQGIGYEAALLFLKHGHEVHGIDEKPTTIHDENYTHYVCSVSGELPEIKDVNVLVNNAGVQDEERSIEVNLIGTIRCTEKYAMQPKIKSVLNVVSASSHSGAEFPYYVASKGGVLAYTKYTALQLAKYGATCNSISPGGVITPMNEHILNDKNLYQAVLDETLLNKWASAVEIAEWIYFVTILNSSMTGQDILIDNGEMAKSNFIW